MIQYITLTITTGINPYYKNFTEPYPEFDPESVKHGNIKDPQKIAAKIEDERLKHIAGFSDYEANLLKKAPMSPLTGCILSLDMMDGASSKPDLLNHTSLKTDENFTEAQLINAFYSACLEASNNANGVLTISGWAVNQFILPFIHKRAISHGIKVPDLFNTNKSGNCTVMIKDLRVWWNESQFSNDSLLDAAKFVGIPLDIDYKETPLHTFYTSGKKSHTQKLDKYNQDVLNFNTKLYNLIK